ncbi:MAG: anhydro-N-acetylmuramic acid kinase, partial [Phycisphaerae bacterium]
MAATQSRIFVGLMSGTSADGVDAVACAIRGRGRTMRPRILAHVHRRYPPALRNQILAVAGGAAAGAADFCRLSWRLGRINALAAEHAVKAAGLMHSVVAAVGMHGQTICHRPPRRRSGTIGDAGTWQIGEPTVVCERLGVPVAARFREADLAAGGQGAPLVPWTDDVLFRHARLNRVVQNLGGIANATWLPAGGTPDDVRAFD